MFCYQCEQTAKGEACTVKGVCGKNEETAGLQDLLIHCLRGLAYVAVKAGKADDPEIGKFTAEALFSTLTNVNFDPERFRTLIGKCTGLRDGIKSAMPAADLKGAPDAVDFAPASDVGGLIAQGVGPRRGRGDASSARR